MLQWLRFGDSGYTNKAQRVRTVVSGGTVCSNDFVPEREGFDDRLYIICEQFLALALLAPMIYERRMLPPGGHTGYVDVC